jgi:hypothetical protein
MGGKSRVNMNKSDNDSGNTWKTWEKTPSASSGGLSSELQFGDEVADEAEAIVGVVQGRNPQKSFSLI